MIFEKKTLIFAFKVIWCLEMIDAADDCYTDSATYKGDLSVTVSGRMCQAWSLNTPHFHSYHDDYMFPDGKVYAAANFCRDPSRDGFVWCYTVDPGKRWEKCLIQSCKVTDSTISNSINDPKPTQGQETTSMVTDDCYTDSATYKGDLSVTVSGKMCQAWSLNRPHFHSYHDDNMFPGGKVDTAANFCRDPSRDGFLWCYTVDPEKRWEECLIQSCKVTVCSGTSCANGGQLVRLEDECICNCTEGFGGDSCEIVVVSSEWPDGPYALPMLRNRCPEGQEQGWTPGHIHVSTKQTQRTSEGFDSPIDHLQLNHTFATVNGSSFELKFCSKAADSVHGAHKNAVAWPDGVFGIFGINQSCPRGFVYTDLRLSLHNTTTVYFEGVVPVVFNETVNELVIHICTKAAQGLEQNTSHFKWNISFNLLKKGHCPIAGEFSVREVIVFLPGIWSETSYKIELCVFEPHGLEKLADVRLIHGDISSEGLVQIQYGGHWWSICNGQPHNWGETEANIACRMLGYSYGRNDTEMFPGNVSVQAFTLSLKCYGGEEALSDCSIYWHDSSVKRNCSLMASAGCFRYVEGCLGVTCSNDGILKKENSKCICICPYGYLGLLCETEIGVSIWPPGPFALPMSNDSCPEDWGRGWRRSYVHVVLKDPWFWENSTITTQQIKPKDVFGQFTENSFMLTFCVKSENTIFTNGGTALNWPEGSYGVYQLNRSCPAGFLFRKEIIQLPDVETVNMDGLVPVEFLSHNGTLIIYTCLKNRTRSILEEPLPWKPPFIILKAGDDDCMNHDSSIVSSENVSLPALDGIDIIPHSMEFCFYRESVPCNGKTWLYRGYQSTTVSGRKCQHWLVDVPHVTIYFRNASLFPDVNDPATKNYCRDPLQEGFLWCWTNDPQKVWDYCNITTCSVPDRCYQKLGLTDSNFNTLQLTSSSEDSIYSLSRIGLYDMGWCALSRDQNPFVQVDLPFATVVEGLQVHNTFSFVSGDRTSRRVDYQAGARELVISYGVDIEEFMIYMEEDDVIAMEKIFSLDSFDYVKTISFATPFIARYVRIALVGVWDRPCLRLELIGCRKSVDYTCKPGSVRRVLVSRLEGFVRASQLDIPRNESFEACAKEGNSRNGVAVQYTRDTNQCSILMDNTTALTWIDKENYTLQLCADGIVASSKSFIREYVREIHGPGYIASDGYPLHYNSYTDVMWIVQMEQKAYPDIYFIDISLRDIGNGTRGDKIYVSANSSNLHSIELITITSVMNGHQVRQLAPRNHIFIKFYTNEYDVKVREGRGFIAVLKKSSYRRCVKGCGNFDNDIPALIISKSLLIGPGISTDFEQEIWFNNDGCDCIIYLSLVYLDVVCGLSQLIVERSSYTWESRESWCNLNRPHTDESRRILPKDSMKVTFRPYPVRDRSRQEGFEMKYISGQRADRCITLNSDYTMTKKFCFTIQYNRTKPTWSEANKICGRNNFGRLATLHTEEEFRIAQRLLYDSTAYFQMYNSFSRVAYIGFRRNPDGQIKGDSRNFTWLDGRPLTYSAWGGGFPNLQINWDCAVLNGTNFDQKAHIENTLCSARVTQIFICEINSSNTSMQQLLPGRDRGLNSSHLWKCRSGEFILLTYHCDGIPNCLDGSDEEHCIYTASDNSSCPDNAFQCSDKQCISSSQFCDHKKDCNDGSDEVCVYIHCGVDEFKCVNGQCIAAEDWCNAKEDCTDGSDEIFCTSCSGQGKTTFLCVAFKCIRMERVCDGFYDCPDMDDEDKCTDDIKTCQDWWKSGKRMTGVYAVSFEYTSRMKVQCNFDHLDGSGMLTKVYNVDYVVTDDKEGNTYKLIYSTEESEVLRYSINKGRTCTQSISLSCAEPVQKIADLLGRSLFPECTCRELTVYTSVSSNSTMSLTQVLGYCAGSSIEYADVIYQEDIVAYLDQGNHSKTHYPWANITFTVKSTDKQRRITVGPLVCNETFHQDDGKMPCDKGHPVSNQTRCLYDYDRFGSPVGCADGSHTRNCETFICPENFVKCPGSYCLAVRFICDGLKQCPNGDDEVDCGSHGRDCHEYLRCAGTNICLPPSQVCDEFEHCPSGDDEKFCNMSCPGTCICRGTVVDCRDGLTNVTEIALLSPESRKINFNNSTIGNISVPFILPMAFLLNLSDSGVEEIQPESFESMKNLRTLDLSCNNLIVLHENTFKGLERLHELFLYNNQYLNIIERGAFRDLGNIEEIAITHSSISYLVTATFEGLKNLKKIDLRFNIIYKIENSAFFGLDKLEDLLISGNAIKLFESEIFNGLPSLHHLKTDKYALCCLKPKSVDEDNCFPQKDEFSSCEDLMRNEILRALLWIIGMLSLIGNLASFIYRRRMKGMQPKMAYGIFVTNLTLADFMMGIYLLIIAVADTHFRKTFIWNNEWWRSSAYCTVAGVVSILSSEASIFFVILITLDRILAVKFPFGHVRITPNVSIVVSCLAWLIAIVLSMLPLGLNMYFQGQFYSRTTVCLALPLTTDKPHGWEYSFSIFIILNLLLFILIAFGQLLILKEIRASSARLKKHKNSRDKDLVVARNLLFIVMTNFLCWFPIGLMGTLALMDYSIPAEVYAWASVLILPINSALNPILYTLSAAIKREKFVPVPSEQSFVSYEDITRVEYLFGFDALCTNDVRNLTCASECIRNRSLGLNQIMLVARKMAERFDVLHERMLYYGNLTTDNIWIFLHDKEIKGIWLQGKPKRAVNKQVQSTDIRLLGSVLGALLKPYGHVGHEIEGQ